MLRISMLATGEAMLVKLEGKLLEPWCAEVNAACQHAMSRGLPVQLDLTDVTFVDAPGVQLLRRLLVDRVSLGQCSSFITQLLHGERT